MATDIPSGAQVPTNELPVHPIDASATPATLPAAVRVPVASGPASAGPLIGGVAPTTAMFGEQAAAGEAAIAPVLAAAMSAETQRRTHYQDPILPVAGHTGDEMALPVVPDNAVPASQSDLYPYAGMEPTPASVGFFHGNEPLPE